MSRILVNPDQLGQLGADLRQYASQLRSVSAQLGGALGRLDWMGGARAEVEGQAASARQQAGHLGELAEQMAQFLLARAELFRAADGQALGALPWSSGTSAPSAPPLAPWGAVAAGSGLGATVPMILGGRRRRHPDLFGGGTAPGPLAPPARLHRIQREGPSPAAPLQAVPPTEKTAAPAAERSRGNLVDVRNRDFGKRVNAPLTNDPGNRTPDTYNQLLDQFNVETNPRYAEREGNTLCNAYVLDVLWAAGTEIPHMNADGVATWLEQQGQAHGWRAVSAAEAQDWANNGYPTVAAYYGGAIESGHLAMVRPGPYDEASGPTISQAGAENLNQTTVVRGFGESRKQKIIYYVHE